MKTLHLGGFARVSTAVGWIQTQLTGTVCPASTTNSTAPATTTKSSTVPATTTPSTISGISTTKAIKQLA